MRDDKLMDAKFVKALKATAPGTPLREGLENILRAKTGALIVVSDNPAIMEVVDGGFAINCEFTPANFYELAKMDGAIIVSPDTKRILYANAQLIPDPSIPSLETGTRHRTAERVAKQTGELVVAISQRRNLITLYQGSIKYTLKDIEVLLTRVNQALQALEKYKKVLEQGLINLSALEFEDLVTLQDVAVVIQRTEKVLRIGREIERFIVELGTEGRLAGIQLEELMDNVDDILLLVRDYSTSGEAKDSDVIKQHLLTMSDEGPDMLNICRLLGYNLGPAAIDMPVTPRGFRILKKIPRLPMTVIENLVAAFKTLQRINNASIHELDDVEGIGEVRARAIKEGLRRIREQAQIERHI